MTRVPIAETSANGPIPRSQSATATHYRTIQLYRAYSPPKTTHYFTRPSCTLTLAKNTIKVDPVQAQVSAGKLTDPSGEDGALERSTGRWRIMKQQGSTTAVTFRFHLIVLGGYLTL